MPNTYRYTPMNSYAPMQDAGGAGGVSGPAAGVPANAILEPGTGLPILEPVTVAFILEP